MCIIRVYIQVIVIQSTTYKSNQCCYSYNQYTCTISGGHALVCTCTSSDEPLRVGVDEAVEVEEEPETRKDSTHINLLYQDIHIQSLVVDLALF